MELRVLFAGTAGSAPTARRGLPSALIMAGGDRLLFDCGEGTQRQLLRSVGLPEIDAIFLTHYHLDHWLGLPGMVKTFDLRDRTKPLTVYGPEGLEALQRIVKPIIGRVGYPLTFRTLDRYEEVRYDGYAISGFPVVHRVPAFGYAFAEDERPGRFDPETAQRLGVPFGPDFGRLQRGEVVNGVHPDQVIGPSRPGRRVVLSGDTAPCQGVEALAHDADVLVHEATFVESEHDRARETGHSTARQAARIAADAGVRLLVLNHLSTRFFPREFREEAQEVFPNTVIARDFDEIEIPFPERGEPHLVDAGMEPGTHTHLTE